MEGDRTVPGRRGLLIVDKPKGISSYDVIRRMKRFSGSDKIGHAGTLDPFASGVLIVLIGEATKINRFLDPFDKEYEFEILLGIETDTLDRTGRMARKGPVPALTVRAIEGALGGLTGSLRQVPPRYSAVNIDGTRAYRLAADGVDFEPEPKTVEVYRFELVKFNPPAMTLRAVVSKGTYIRSLARDLGAALGTPATVQELVRTRVGPFTLEPALPLEGLTGEKIDERLVDLNRALAHLPRVMVGPEARARIIRGRTIGIGETSEFAPGAGAADLPVGPFIRIVDRSGSLLVIGKRFQGGIQPFRLIYADN